LTKILAEAALDQNYEVRTSELHGLSQRGGSVETHIRFGREVYSPLVRQGDADLIISIEAQESLKSCFYASKKEGTVFLINDFSVPIFGQKSIPLKEILKTLKKFSKKIVLVPATQITKKQLGNPVVAGIYLLSFASFANLVPLEPSSILRAIKKVVTAKYFELNKKAFELAKKL
jgi:indolepyruvate ferredoxin oxidoreductase beta subunit